VRHAMIGDVTTKRRNSGIDLFRGLLVLAVVLGHFSELTQRHSFLTWVGAGLRMPLFIGLTGYLFNIERARAMPLLHLMRKYQRRLILPWLVACIVYLTATEQLDILTPFSIFVQPPFHLWFVPVMMAFIVAATVVRRPPLVMLGIAIPISISAMYLFGVGHSVAQMPPWMPDRRFFIYPIYFFYGLWVACRKPDPWKERAALVLALISFAWWCTLYQTPSLTAEVAAELTSCMPLICLLPYVRRWSLSVPPLAAVGRDSLFFYLWHPMAFGLWAACGVHGLPMLMFSMLTLMGARALLSSLPRAGRIFGLSPRSEPMPITAASPFVTPLQEPVQ
jgi:acyltransferase